MKILGTISWCFIVALILACGFASFIVKAPYSKQFREAPNSAPSTQFVLGTDELGRDRLSRLLYGGRISLVLAPIGAGVSVLLAALIGTFAGYTGGIYERVTLAIVDLFLSLPWLFLLITVRALLPLNVSPVVSVTITYAILGLLGWAATARITCASIRKLKHSEFMLTARAIGCSKFRTMIVQLLPNLKPILWSQFLIAIPIFVLAEADLSILGLGVAEPLPSWGNSMRELQNSSALLSQPWRLASLFALTATVLALQIIASREKRGTI